MINIRQKANRTLFMLQRSLRGASSKTKILAFNTVVRPLLDYASPVWSPYNKGPSYEIDKIQQRAVRWAFRLATLDSVSMTMVNNCIKSLLTCIRPGPTLPCFLPCL